MEFNPNDFPVWKAPNGGQWKWAMAPKWIIKMTLFVIYMHLKGVS